MLNRLIVMLFATLSGCTPAQNANELNSATIADKGQRMAQLEKVTKIETEILDAEYQLYNANGFAPENNRDIPAPSYWLYKFAVKINPKHEMNWTNGLIEVTLEDDYDTTWTKEVVAHRLDDWQTTTTPQLAVLKEPGRRIEQLTYVEEGIVFRKIIQE